MSDIILSDDDINAILKFNIVHTSPTSPINSVVDCGSRGNPEDISCKNCPMETLKFEYDNNITDDPHWDNYSTCAKKLKVLKRILKEKIDGTIDNLLEE